LSLGSAPPGSGGSLPGGPSSLQRRWPSPSPSLPPGRGAAGRPRLSTPRSRDSIDPDTVPSRPGGRGYGAALVGRAAGHPQSPGHRGGPFGGGTAAHDPGDRQAAPGVGTLLRLPKHDRPGGGAGGSPSCHRERLDPVRAHRGSHASSPSSGVRIVRDRRGLLGIHAARAEGGGSDGAGGRSGRFHAAEPPDRSHRALSSVRQLT
jgi:hypothetical protein